MEELRKKILACWKKIGRDSDRKVKRLESKYGACITDQDEPGFKVVNKNHEEFEFDWLGEPRNYEVDEEYPKDIQAVAYGYANIIGDDHVKFDEFMEKLKFEKVDWGVGWTMWENDEYGISVNNYATGIDEVTVEKR